MGKKGQHLAILSAILFGMSPVACKAIVGQMPSALLAGLLYLGSGLGLTGAVLRQKIQAYEILRGLSWRQRADLAGAIVSGGVAAPLFLAYGIRFGTASEVSLLLNFEAVATTLIAWMAFREYIGYRVWIGKVFIIGASILIVFTGSKSVQLSIPGISVLAACILWGIDNNLTRELESIPAALLACIKGWSAGIFNVLLSLFLFESHATAFQVSGVLVIGALSYGASLVFFIHALREIGSARTSTWFASGPFIGAILSVIALGERPPVEYWVAALIMLSGMFFLYFEVHLHLHRHQPLAHAHPHEHDEHHRHEHDYAERKGKHDHYHVHEPITHAHLHWPDIHHRHDH
ncbi:Permease of the drug/metabolite transporter (DMT) superfamily [Syntrophus gentianae]|uniref:Permease of the drug/metabolite transporter (DMT) superfamily n=1 Tax=Syntrophus gentianae TaxID=43775 RepID=A0A1H7XW41_9BACT|nr:DMT family transporter [Syntrophus gentianae]SEM37219.1 Permease of the drug/metabolite transporter (DMT) superfamily [Syntrophus gentianae]